MAAQYISKINGYVIKDEEARQAASAAQQTANSANTLAGQAKGRADDAHLLAETAYNIAQGKTEAIVFENLQDLFEELVNHYNAGLEDGELSYPLPIGTNLLIKEEQVPDYWISDHLEENKATPEGSAQIGESGVYKYYHVGYYEISFLESEKVDLSGYAQTTGTYPNMTVGTATLANTAQLAHNATTAGKVENSATFKVFKNNAESSVTFDGSGGVTIGDSTNPVMRAYSATKATQDANGNVINSTYATKGELNGEKITVKVASEEMQILKNGVMITPTT